MPARLTRPSSHSTRRRKTEHSRPNKSTQRALKVLRDETLKLLMPELQNHPAAGGHGHKLSTLLDRLWRLIRRYVVLSDEQLTAIVLWVAHAHALQAFEVRRVIRLSPLIR
jgi:hypothetical protein